MRKLSIEMFMLKLSMRESKVLKISRCWDLGREFVAVLKILSLPKAFEWNLPL
jgi:hypothetical protein